MNLFFRSTTRPDWQGLIQYGVAALGSVLVINAFRKHSAAEEPSPAPALQTAIPQPRAEIKSWLPKFSFPSVKKQESKVSKIAPAKKERISAGKSTAKKASNTLAIQKTAPKKIAKPAALKKLAVTAPPAPKTKRAARNKKKNAKPEIKFVGKEEHTCPYCLDPVEDHDPRGVKICSICKTRHHADCWGITGACQIPHSNEKKKH